MLPRWIPAVLLACVLTSSCAHEYRVYDPDRHDYHNWDDHERDSYNRWAHETHHEDRDYKKLNGDEQRQYWEWRHQQGSHE